MSLACVGSVHSVCTMVGLPPLTARVLYWSTLLRFQVALQGSCAKWVLGFVNFPGLSCSGPGSRVLHKTQTRLGLCFVPFPHPRSSDNQVLGEHTLPDGLYVLITSLVTAAWFPGCTAGAPSQMCCVSPLGGWSLAVTLLADVNHPGSQEDLVSNWEPAHNLVEDAVSGAEIAPCFPALAGARLPLCLWRGDGPVHSQLALLWYLLNSLWAGQAVT